MFENLPSDYTVALDWGWDDWQPYFAQWQAAYNLRCWKPDLFFPALEISL